MVDLTQMPEDHLEALRELTRVSKTIRKACVDYVLAARRSGARWAEIAAALGVDEPEARKMITEAELDS